MEMELEGLIDKIKKEGVEEADKKAKSIIDEAEKKAKDILTKAKEQNEKIVNNAKQDAEKLKKQAEESIRQSMRDTVLMLKKRITDLFDSVLKKNLSEQMTADVLGEAISELIKNFKKDETFNVEILLNEKNKKTFEEKVLSLLSAEIKKGVTFKVSPSVELGFRIGEKDKNCYYDFTAEAINEALRVYLNPKLTEILDAGK